MIPYFMEKRIVSGCFYFKRMVGPVGFDKINGNTKEGF